MAMRRFRGRTFERSPGCSLNRALCRVEEDRGYRPSASADARRLSRGVVKLASQKGSGRLLDMAPLVLAGATLLVLMLVGFRDLCIGGVCLRLGVLRRRSTCAPDLSSGIGDLLGPNSLTGFGFLRYAAGRGRRASWGAFLVGIGRMRLRGRWRSFLLGRNCAGI